MIDTHESVFPHLLEIPLIQVSSDRKPAPHHELVVARLVSIGSRAESKIISCTKESVNGKIACTVPALKRSLRSVTGFKRLVGNASKRAAVGYKVADFFLKTA